MLGGAHPLGSGAGRKGTGMESSLSRVIAVLPGLLWTALSDGRTEFVNRRWREYTGRTFDEASRSDWQTEVHPDGRLWAQPNDGPGATFAFSVPCTSDGAAAAPEPAQLAPAAGPRPAMVKR